VIVWLVPEYRPVFSVSNAQSAGIDWRCVMRLRGQGRGSGGGNRPGAGPSGVCVCPKCGHEVPHTVGTPCYSIACPKCGTKMLRG